MSPTIAERLRADGPSFSFEFFPPKDDAAERQLWQALRELERLRPTFVSVTYGAGGSTREGTVRVTERVATQTTMLPMAHLTAGNHSIGELRRVLGRFAAAGVRNVLAIRGDPPGDPGGRWERHPTGLSYTEGLVRLIKSSGDFCVGVAAFPHKHPRSPNLTSDAHYLARKIKAGADFAITQMFFVAEDYLRLRDRLAAMGCDVPIIPGIMPVASLATIDRSEQLSGAPFPEALRAQFEAVSDDPAAVRGLGIEQASLLCQRLLAEGAPGIHFITMNRSTATREIWSNLQARVHV